MAQVRVTFFAGRTNEQKDRLTAAITDAMSEIAGSYPEGVHVIYEEIRPENWYIGNKPAAAQVPAKS
jgi:4-oxalocrotonate tautomerase